MDMRINLNVIAHTTASPVIITATHHPEITLISRQAQSLLPEFLLFWTIPDTVKGIVINIA